MAGPITVFGGTGFIGRHLVPLLVRSGETVRLAVRLPGRVQMVTVSGQPPEIIQADLLDEVGVDSAIAGADAVVNLVGILTETTTQTYHAIHVEGARRVALAAQRHGVMRLIHISALGSYSAAARFGVGSSGSPGWPVNLSPSAHISSACFFIAGRTEAIFATSRSAAIPG
jgi:nucleoside-diphosphate-sugar epimerase